jgi:predicted TIM-barrel fold metal-dependent hydrolase
VLILGEDLVVDYPIVDADAHVNEPPNLWQERVPAKLRERAPKVIPFEKGGDAWSFEDGQRIAPVGLTATAGLSYVGFKSFGISYESMRPGSFDPAARLVDMDLDGIYAQVLYPSVTLSGAKIYSEDTEMQQACVRAYNDWLADFCAHDPQRLIPIAIIPTVGIEAACAELDHALKRGHRGAVLSAYPNGSLDPTDEDDRLWARIVEADVPIHLHIGSFQRQLGGIPLTGTRFLGQVGNAKAGGSTLPVAEDFLFSGIFDKFPDLKAVLVEANIGWIPTMLEQTDDMFLRYRFWTGGAHLKLPSEVFYRNFWSTFMIDTHGVANRYKCGLDHIMWSTDYPHTGTDWPNSRVTLERNFRGVPYDEVKLMIHDNAAKLYKIEIPG